MYTMYGLYRNKKKRKVYWGINTIEIFCYQKQWDYFYNKHTLPNVQSYVN